MVLEVSSWGVTCSYTQSRIIGTLRWAPVEVYYYGCIIFTKYPFIIGRFDSKFHMGKIVLRVILCIYYRPCFAFMRAPFKLCNSSLPLWDRIASFLSVTLQTHVVVLRKLRIRYTIFLNYISHFLFIYLALSSHFMYLKLETLYSS